MRRDIKKRKNARLTPEQQLWWCLRTDEQRALMEQTLSHLNASSQELLCYALITYLRWGIIHPFCDKWLDVQFKALVLYLKVEKESGNL